MGRDHQMSWNKFTGTITDGHSEATCEMIEYNKGWRCSWKRMNEEAAEYTVQTFEPGQLGAAHDWCIQQIDNYEIRRPK